MTAEPPNLTPEQTALFHSGLALFNAGDYFEAHEAWEELWHSLTGEPKRFMQGLIQCAVTLEHVRRGNPRGVVTVFASAQTRLKGFPPVYMGLPIGRLQEDLAKFIEPIRQMPREYFEPRKGRGLAMPVELENAPRIEMT